MYGSISSSVKATFYWIAVLFGVLCLLGGVAGLGLGAWCYVHKQDIVVEPPPTRIYEARSFVYNYVDTKTIPNQLTITFEGPHTIPAAEANTNGLFFQMEARSLLDGLVRPTFLRELNSTSAVVEVLPIGSSVPASTQGLINVYDLSVSGVVGISTNRLEHTHHRHLVRSAPINYTISSSATLNAGDTFKGVSCLFYTDHSFAASSDNHCALMYSFYSPLTAAWSLPQRIEQYANSGATAIGVPFDFDLTVFNKRPTIVWFDPTGAHSNPTTTIKALYLDDPSTAAASTTSVDFATVDPLINLTRTSNANRISTLAAVEFNSDLVVGFISVNNSVQKLALMKAMIANPTSATPTITPNTTVVSVVTSSTLATLTATESRCVQLTPLTLADGTQRLVVSLIVGTSTSGVGAGVAFISSSVDILSGSNTWTQISVASNIDSSNSDSSQYSSLVMLSPSAGQLVAVWQDATSGFIRYCYSVNTAGVFTFPSANVVTLAHKCNGTFTAAVMNDAERPNGFAILYKVASDALTAMYRYNPIYAYVAGPETTAQTILYSSLYRNDGIDFATTYSSSTGSVVGLCKYESAPCLFVSGAPGAGTRLINYQGNADNLAMTPGLRVNYHVY